MRAQHITQAQRHTRHLHLQDRHHGSTTHGHSRLVGVNAAVDLVVELVRLHDGLVVAQFLGAHARNPNHGKAAVLQLLRLHIGKILGVLRLQAHRVKADVPRVVCWASEASVELG